MSCFPSRFSDGIEPVPKVRRVTQESTSRRAKRPLDVLTEWAYAVYSCKTRNADSRSFRWWRVFSVAATSAPADPRRPFSARASKQSSVWEEEDGTSTAAVRPRVASDVAVVAARPSPGGGEDAQLGFGSASRASRDVHGAGSPALGPLRDPLAAGGRARAPRARSSASVRRARASSPAVAARRRAPPRATANPIFAKSRFAGRLAEFFLRSFASPPSRPTGP